jgi:hypothetical protein
MYLLFLWMQREQAEKLERLKHLILSSDQSTAAAPKVQADNWFAIT